jgi:hypothetical protein
VTALYDQLTSPQWIATLEGLLGIPNLHFDELGGGLHRILPGGFLAQHLDFNSVDRPGGVQWRRVNILLYLSECGAGGELRMYGGTAEDERVVVPPKRNRMVVFECSEQSWHGHPYPMQVSPASDGLSRTTGSSACTCVALSQYYGWAARVTTTHWHPRPQLGNGLGPSGSLLPSDCNAGHGGATLHRGVLLHTRATHATSAGIPLHRVAPHTWDTTNFPVILAGRPGSGRRSSRCQ